MIRELEGSRMMGDGIALLLATVSEVARPLLLLLLLRVVIINVGGSFVTAAMDMVLTGAM